ncbi:MAG: hypothetical protein GXX96_20470 [Planctomycetaceae bacterium]|nr:hypothetical protein [Planctomycetaceae bacterium]
MRSYSVPQRLLHALFGGSAIWLGTTFCSPLAAIDFELPLTPASAPEAMVAPDQSPEGSVVPASSLDIGAADHWDTGPVWEDGPCVQEYACEDQCCDEYAYDSFVPGQDEEDAAQPETLVAEGEDADGLVDVPEDAVYSSLEDEDSYEFDDYEMYYGYEYDNADQPMQDQVTADETDAEEVWVDEYEYEYDFNDDCDHEDEYGCGYEDEYDYEVYDDLDMGGMGQAYEAEMAADEMTDSAVEPYDYVDPMNHFGHEYDAPYDWEEMESEEPADTDVDLLDGQPTELLNEADCDLIRSLERLAGKPSAVRRNCLNEYIEGLGFRAIDFAYRYEDAADADVLTLAGDLPRAAAFLAAYRLVEQERIGMDDAVVLLEKALHGLSLDWIEGVNDIVAEDSGPVASHPVVEAMTVVANRSIAGLSALAVAVGERLAQVPWAEISDRLGEVRSASLSAESEDDLTF